LRLRRGGAARRLYTLVQVVGNESCREVLKGSHRSMAILTRLRFNFLDSVADIRSGRLAITRGQFITIRLARRWRCTKSALRQLPTAPYVSTEDFRLGEVWHVDWNRFKSSVLRTGPSSCSRTQGIPSANQANCGLRLTSCSSASERSTMRGKPQYVCLSRIAAAQLDDCIPSGGISSHLGSNEIY
jgi:hypothetical protein